MCKSKGKNWSEYKTLRSTRRFVNELESTLGTGADLIQSKWGGIVQGTWVHPDIALDLGRWISPAFGIALYRLIREYTTSHPKKVLSALTQAWASNQSVSADKGIIYVLQNACTPSRVKIGKSRRSLHQLRRRYITSFPDQTRIWAIETNECTRDEGDIHEFFERHRQAGEWFCASYLHDYLEYLDNTRSGDLLEWSDRDLEVLAL